MTIKESFEAKMSSRESIEDDSDMRDGYRENRGGEGRENREAEQRSEKKEARQE